MFVIKSGNIRTISLDSPVLIRILLPVSHSNCILTNIKKVTKCKKQIRKFIYSHPGK